MMLDENWHARSGTLHLKLLENGAHLKGEFAKNERGYRPTAKNYRWYRK